MSDAPRPVDLHALVRDTVRSLSVRLPALRQKTFVDLTGAAVDVVADGARLAHVVEHLLSNAVEALAAPGEAGIIRVRAWAEPPQARLSVSDTGPGVATEKRPELFAEGGALGECRRIVEGLGGTIGYADTPGGGATFTIALPLAR